MLRDKDKEIFKIRTPINLFYMRVLKSHNFCYMLARSCHFYGQIFLAGHLYRNPLMRRSLVSQSNKHGFHHHFYSRSPRSEWQMAEQPPFKQTNSRLAWLYSFLCRNPNGLLVETPAQSNKLQTYLATQFQSDLCTEIL